MRRLKCRRPLFAGRERRRVDTRASRYWRDDARGKEVRGEVARAKDFGCDYGCRLPPNAPYANAAEQERCEGFANCGSGTRAMRELRGTAACNVQPIFHGLAVVALKAGATSTAFDRRDEHEGRVRVDPRRRREARDFDWAHLLSTSKQIRVAVVCRGDAGDTRATWRGCPPLFLRGASRAASCLYKTPTNATPHYAESERHREKKKQNKEEGRMKTK